MRGNLALGTNAKSLLQAIDQPTESLLLLFCDAHHAPNGTGVVGGAAGLRDGDRPLISIDPLADLSAALGEQAQEVFGLAMIRVGSRRSSGVIDNSDRPVHAPRRGGLALVDEGRSGAGHAATEITCALVTHAVRQVLSDCLGASTLGLGELSVGSIRVYRRVRAVCARCVGQRGEVHRVSLNYGVCTFGIRTIACRNRREPYAATMKLKISFVRAA
jgi:hypothetical protein